MIYETTVIGYPYIGEQRQWKKTVESFWKGMIDEQTLHAQLKEQRLENVKRQYALGVETITTGDFTYYDRMLDLAIAFNLIPKRYAEVEKGISTYYAMARGTKDVVASEMTKWFNTNYHYIVPEYEGQRLRLQSHRYIEYIDEALQLGVTPKPTFIGPYTFFTLTKGIQKEQEAAFLLDLIHVYTELLQQVAQTGVTWIQLEEPAFTTTLNDEQQQLIQALYTQICEQVDTKIFVTTYFEACSAYDVISQLPIDGLGLDFVHGKKENIENLRKHGFPEEKVLGVGIVNGRDIWAANLAQCVTDVRAIEQLVQPTHVWLQTSCSLQHVPVSAMHETKLPQFLQPSLAFADEKIRELVAIRQTLDGTEQTTNILAESLQQQQVLLGHKSRHNEHVAEALRTLQPAHYTRDIPFEKRQALQIEALQLPDFPTTTIGSFPQSTAVKQNRAKWRKQAISNSEYEAFIEEEMKRWITIQEEIGLDVLVHGEFERTDMVEFFGEKLDGFAFTQNGWVVSYGSRCVKPPIIYGDVAWVSPMTVNEIKYAQQYTQKHVKGMLTGPVTILNWSFVRDDIPREVVAQQIALALRKEIASLEDANVQIIQVDEPALREGLPLRKEQHADYLRWSVDAFKLATSGVAATTQIHTHMCYCEFNDFLAPITALDADVISLETSRSHGELIDVLATDAYPYGIGLGVYDIHSPRVPSVEEMLTIATDSLHVIPRQNFWVNPDCGLKTRGEQETIAALSHMVEVAQQLRQRVTVQ